MPSVHHVLLRTGVARPKGCTYSDTNDTSNQYNACLTKGQISLYSLNSKACSLEPEMTATLWAVLVPGLRGCRPWKVNDLDDQRRRPHLSRRIIILDIYIILHINSE